jgi:porin
MAAGAIWEPTKWLKILTAVADNDPDGGATRTGFNTAFHGRDWLTAIQEYDVTWKPFGQTGHQRFGWFFTTRDFSELAEDPRVQLPVQSSTEARVGRFLVTPAWFKALRVFETIDAIRNPQERLDNWGIYYNFDQFLYTEAEDPEQGWGVFGRFGFAPNGGNIFEEFYSLGLSGKGAIPTRDRDSWGLGYYLANTTDDLSNLLGVHAEQGVELYYNIEITPWLHITPDLQVIVDPGAGFDNRDPAIVYGLRMQMSF